MSWFHGLVVRTLDIESSNPSSSICGTLVLLLPYSRVVRILDFESSKPSSSLGGTSYHTFVCLVV